MKNDSSVSGLAIADVSVGYGQTRVVNEASLRLQPGQVTALVGPNGSGKSTLLRAVAALHPIESGEVRFDTGESTGELQSKQLAKRLTMLTQMRPTPQGVRVRNVVALGRHPYRGRFGGGDTEGNALVDRAMRLTGVDSLSETPVNELSGGQMQRVWLAMCLAQDTEVLLLDEPTNHLDIKYQVELLELLYSLAHDHGVCVGVVLHDLNQAATVADTVAVLSAGRIVGLGHPTDVLISELLSEVYDIEITCAVDPITGLMTVRGRPPRMCQP